AGAVHGRGRHARLGSRPGPRPRALWSVGGVTEADAPLRLGLVGCGGISERHGNAAASTPAVAIVACCDVRLELARNWAGRYGCERAYSDYGTMIEEHDLEGVLVATWPS